MISVLTHRLITPDQDNRLCTPVQRMPEPPLLPVLKAISSPNNCTVTDALLTTIAGHEVILIPHTKESCKQQTSLKFRHSHHPGHHKNVIIFGPKFISFPSLHSILFLIVIFPTRCTL